MSDTCQPEMPRWKKSYRGSDCGFKWGRVNNGLQAGKRRELMIQCAESKISRPNSRKWSRKLRRSNWHKFKNNPTNKTFWVRPKEATNKMSWPNSVIKMRFFTRNWNKVMRKNFISLNHRKWSKQSIMKMNRIVTLFFRNSTKTIRVKVRRLSKI